MKQREIFLCIIMSIVLVGLISACNKKQSIEEKLMFAAGILNIKSDNGVGSCTTTAFEKNGDVYRFITAAHCVAKYNETTKETILGRATYKIVLEDEVGNETSYVARVIAVGELKYSEDVAVLEAEINEVVSFSPIVDFKITSSKSIPLIPISDRDPELAEDIIMVTAPIGLGNQLLKGYISRPVFYQDVIVSGMNWKGDSLMQVNGLGTGEGSSGGAIVSKKNGAIIATVVGYARNWQGHVSMVVLPISKFKKFYSEFKQGRRVLTKEAQNECTISIKDLLKSLK